MLTCTQSWGDDIIMKKLFLLGILSILSAPAVADEFELRAVENAKQKWAYARITDYQFTLTSRENWGATETALIVVKDGVLESAGIIIRRSNPVPENEASETSGMRKTIDDLFAEMLSRKDFLRANFDQKTGRPTDIWYKHEDWDDAENQYEIRDFALTNQ
jgi:hypothetical protein